MVTALIVIYIICLLFGWCETPEQKTARETEELKNEVRKLREELSKR